jgi:hypothetical protein
MRSGVQLSRLHADAPVGEYGGCRVDLEVEELDGGANQTLGEQHLARLIQRPGRPESLVFSSLATIFPLISLSCLCLPGPG